MSNKEFCVRTSPRMTNEVHKFLKGYFRSKNAAGEFILGTFPQLHTEAMKEVSDLFMSEESINVICGVLVGQKKPVSTDMLLALLRDNGVTRKAILRLVPRLTSYQRAALLVHANRR